MDINGLYMAKIPIKLWLKLNDPEYEIFRRSSHMFNDFVCEVKAPTTGIVINKLIKLDETLQDVVELIQNHIKSLDEIKNKEEITYWDSQITKLEDDVDDQIKIHVESFQKDPVKDRENLERASQELLALKRASALDWKSFAKVKGYPIESEVSEVKGHDKNLDNVKETKDVTMMVEGENELDGKLDDKSLVVEKVDDIPEASEKEIDDKLKEKVSHDIYAPEAASNDVKELLDNPEATEADVVSSVNDPTQPQHELNACFAKEMQIEHDSDETSEELNGNQVDINEVVKVVTEKGEDQKPDSKSHHDIAKNDDDKVFDVKIENSKLSDEEAIVKVNEEDTDEDVRGNDEISVSENDDQFNNEVNEDILDKVKDLAVDVRDNSKEILENPNEFTEAKVERNVVKLLFEGTFKENSEEILENLDKFPEPEIKVEEVGSDEANVLKPEPKIEANAVEPPLDNDLDESLDEGQEYNLEVDVKATKDNALRVAFAQKVVPVGIEKSAVDGSVAKEPDPDATAVNAGNLTPEVKTNVKAENEEHENLASLSQRTLKLKTIALWEKLMYIRKVGHFQFDAIVVDKHEFDKEHNCVLAKVLVITTFIQPMDMPVNYFLLLYDVSRLDNFKLLLSFPWRPGDLLNWVCYNAMMFFVLVLQLLYVLKESKVCSVMTPTAACEKSDMEADDSELEQLEPKSDLPVFLLDVNTDQGQEEDVLVDEIASADTSMVDDLAFVMPRLFPRLVYLEQFTPLKIITPGTTYTVSERWRS